MERVYPSKLPLEILRMVFLKIDEDDPIDELKKFKLVSPRFYKAVQDLFQDEFVQKLCTHFDGSKYNYTKCRPFGMNIFGSYKLNFPTVKISRSEYYLMKSWLEKVIPTNLQTLELKDNQLDWKEIILILKKFSSIVNLKFLQTSEDMKVADRIFQLFQIKSEPNTNGYKPKVKEQIVESEIFLPNLKSFETHIVHIRVLNILSFIISQAGCKLESFSIKIDLVGVCHCSQVSENLLIKILRRDPIHSFKIGSLNHFKKFSKWLKNLEIKIFYSDSLFRLSINGIFKISSFRGYEVVYKSILRMFLKPDKLKMFTNIENLKIKLPFIFMSEFPLHFFDEKHKTGLFEFVKNQQNLQKVAMSPNFFGPVSPEGIARFKNILKNLMVTPKSTFEYHVSHNGFEPILGFSENLSKLKFGVSEDMLRHFSDPRTPVFRNCTGLAVTFYLHRWDDFEIRGIIEKFPNLKYLALIVQQWIDNDQVFTNDDLQLIIRQYKNLKSLYFENLEEDYDYDSGLTGLSLEAIEARKENPGLPIGPGDRIGLPISHLKNLESLIIRNDYYRLQISDVSAHHGFDKMPNLRHLDLKRTNITRNGFERILEKAKSKNLNIIQPDPDDSDSGSDDDDDGVIIYYSGSG